MSDARTQRHRKAFRLLLAAYPRWFREAHGEEMTLLFCKRLERAQGRADRLRLWWRTLADTGSNAAALRRRDARREGRTMGTLTQDTRHAVRRLVRSPGFTLGAAALLAIGMGANVAVFAFVDALVLQAPPWTEPERVVHVYQDSDEGEPNANAFPAVRDMAAYDVFEAVTGTAPWNATWEGPDGPEPVALEFTLSSHMRVLGLDVQRGRWFGPEHDAVGGPMAAVVSASAWRTRFGSDPGLLGRTVQLNGYPVSVVGIGPEELTSTAPPLVTDFWLSISTTPVAGSFFVDALERREDHWYLALARLAPGVTVAQAQAAMDALARTHGELYPETDRGRGITVFPSEEVRLHPSQDGAIRLGAALLAAVALTVLLLTCANLANLLLVRGLGRSGEMAVRSALGASRSRVARLFLIESLLLAGLGGLAGLLLARFALAAVPALPLTSLLGTSLELRLDARVVLFALALVTVTGLLFGLAPAARSARTDVSRALRDDARAASAGRGTLRLRSALVAVQVAASLVLVLGTGLLARSLAALQTADVGVDAERLAYVRIDWARAGLGAQETRAAVDELRERIEALPGVERAALTSRLPAEGVGTTTTEVEGYTPPAGTGAVELAWAVVTDSYFETMGIPLVAGRAFGPDDVAGGGVSIVISEAAARRFWGDADPIGRRMRGQGEQEWTRAVVGVAADVAVSSVGAAPEPFFYFTSRQSAPAPTYVVARTEGGDPAAVLGAMRREIAAWQPSVTVSGQGTLPGHLGASLAAPRLAARAMGAFSALALVLAALGVYTVVSFTVARRASELGLRIALGAERSAVVGMVVREVARVVALGLIAGLAVAALAASRLGGLLYGIEALDPLSFGGAVALLLGVAAAAAYLPARRAARADPVQALRIS